MIENLVRILCTLKLLFIAQSLMAQSTPAEFAEMSLEELFNTSIDVEGTEDKAREWLAGYQYKKAKFSGYLDDSDALSNEDVLFRPGDEMRTDKNFPVLPTVISQEVHLFKLATIFSGQYRIDLSIPHIRQSTDHISIVPGYDTFLISTSGFGDIGISSGFKLSASNYQEWWLNIGVSLPTGSIDEQGDTPRAPGDQQLPYTMQLGSGTWDFPVQLRYQRGGQHALGLLVSGTFRTGKNDRQYRLGDNYSLSTYYRYRLKNTLHMLFGADAQYSQSINGRDESLIVEAEFPYPASITNPELFGGALLSLRLGISWQFATNTQISFDINDPIYQSLNGPQPKNNWHGSFQVSRRF